ncbi:hypothetical protein IE53DRAFT_387371 [Violaceomyces palustris]|uniref:Uncharacterized protein n=1 Tax=Violaceomyces palustris TaxID=1673888 RepID=A0ACD0NX38_9BASI|nr:hypothetical protein IE53DRAFT_387371 [Violaceomyces palustris]
MKYLIGRISDPILGITTGIMAYYLWENDGRNSELRPQGRKLNDLLRRRFLPSIASD